MALAPGAAAIATTFHTKFMEAGVQRAEFGGVLDLVDGAPGEWVADPAGTQLVAAAGMMARRPGFDDAG